MVFWKRKRNNKFSGYLNEAQIFLYSDENGDGTSSIIENILHISNETDENICIMRDSRVVLYLDPKEKGDVYLDILRPRISDLWVHLVGSGNSNPIRCIRVYHLKSCTIEITSRDIAKLSASKKIISLQQHFKHYRNKKRQNAATIIQSSFRGFLVRRKVRCRQCCNLVKGGRSIQFHSSARSQPWCKTLDEIEPNQICFNSCSYCFDCCEGIVRSIVEKNQQATIPCFDGCGHSIDWKYISPICSKKLRQEYNQAVERERTSIIKLQSLIRGFLARKPFPCPICLDEYPKGQTLTLYHGNTSCNCCIRCYQTYVSKAVEDGKLYIRCPLYHECKYVLNEQDIEAVGGQTFIEKLRENRMANHMNYLEEIRESGDAKLLKVLSRHDFRACPTCGVIIFKHAGCSHMSCRCGSSFDWSNSIKISSKKPLPKLDDEQDSDNYPESVPPATNNTFMSKIFKFTPFGTCSS